VIPRGIAAGKLDGAWQVVPCSQGTLNSSHTDSFFSIASAGANSNLAPKKVRTQTKIDWVLQDIYEECPKKNLKCS
jgi:hypothetical protein